MLTTSRLMHRTGDIRQRKNIRERIRFLLLTYSFAYRMSPISTVHMGTEMTTTALPNPFEFAPLIPLEDQIENVQLKLERMIRVAETGRDWANIAEVEARELEPLLVLRRAKIERDALDAVAAVLFAAGI